MGYVTVSRGFKSGGFNVRAQATVFPESAEPFKDEVLDVAEVGVKSVLADRHLVLNAAAFYGKYKDIQVSTFTAYDSNGDGVDDAFFGNFLNAGDATMQGVEVEYDWSAAAVDWFGLSGNLSYLDATPDTFLDANHDGFVDTQVITNAPKFTGTLRANVHFPAFGGLITGSVGISHRDESVLTNEGGQYPGGRARRCCRSSSRPSSCGTPGSAGCRRTPSGGSGSPARTWATSSTSPTATTSRRSASCRAPTASRARSWPPSSTGSSRPSEGVI